MSGAALNCVLQIENSLSCVQNAWVPKMHRSLHVLRETPKQMKRLLGNITVGGAPTPHCLFPMGFIDLRGIGVIGLPALCFIRSGVVLFRCAMVK